MRLPVFLTVLLIITAAAGCGGKASKKPEPSPVKIAVSFADMESDGNRIIKNVMESRKKKDKVDITWLDARNDRSKQEQQLEKLSGQKIKALVFQPVDPLTGPDLMRKLAEKNIKVVALDKLPQDVPVDAYVAPDHALAGQLLARFAVRTARRAAGLPVTPDPASYGPGQTGGGSAGQGGTGGSQGTGGQGQGQSQGQGQGKVVVPPETQVSGRIPLGVVLISGDPGDAAAREIAAAARAVLQGSPEVRLLAENQVPQNDPSRVPGILQGIMAEKGGNVQAVLTTDSRLAMAAVEALKAAGLNNRVLTAGVGAGEKASKALTSGEHDAEVDTRPDLLGQYALDAAIDLAKNGRWQYSGQATGITYSVPARITPVRLVESSSAYLLNQRWGGMTGKKGGQGGGQGGSGGGSSGGGQGSGGGDSGGDSGGGDSGGESGGGGQGQSGAEGGQGQGGKGKKTMLRITTQDGKTMEVQIDGEVKKIESLAGGQGGGQGGGGQGGGQGQ